jgi:hypothetical protein
MFKTIESLLVTAVLTLFTICCFAISPGAGQAQIRNNMQTMEQNKKQAQQYKQMQEMKQEYKMKEHQRMIQQKKYQKIQQ